MDTDSEDLDFGEFIGTDVTTSHYIPKTEREKCQNANCGASFQYPSLKRPHHCRRCGEIFCWNCLRNKRRLNIMAQPDPFGVLCKVCPQCYEDRGLDLGCTKRSRTEEFLHLRTLAIAEMEDIKMCLKIESRPTTREPVFWKHQFHVDIAKECTRLIKGFSETVDNFEAINQLQQLKKYVKIPSWQKSTFWKLESRTSNCRQCNLPLERRNQVKNCKVCGLALCKACAHKELLIYFKDGIRPCKNTQASLAIIRVQGSPEIEPKFSMLLYCCSECRGEITRRQIEDEEWFIEKTKPPDFEAEFARLDGEFKKITENITNKMEELSNVLHAKEEKEEDLKTFVVVEPQENSVSNKPSTVGFLKETLNQEIQFYWHQYTELKSLVKSNNGRVKGSLSSLTRNYLRARSEFYLDTKSRLSRAITSK